VLRGGGGEIRSSKGFMVDVRRVKRMERLLRKGIKISGQKKKKEEEEKGERTEEIKWRTVTNSCTGSSRLK